MKAVFLLLTIGLITTTGGLSQTMNELLGRPTNNSITINVLFDSQVDVYFEYGTISDSYTQSTDIVSAMAGEPVEAVMDELLPNTRYYYRTRYRKSDQIDFNASAEHTFITQRRPEAAFRFTIEADPHPYDKKGCWPLWDICLNNQLKDTADFMIDMGDTFGDDHEPYTITSSDVQQLQLSCRDFFGKVCHSLPFIFCIGNHEGESGYYLMQTPPNNLAMYETNWRKLYYPNPYPDGFYLGDTIEEGNGVGLAENYFAWEWGSALFVVLDVYRYATASEKPQKWDWTIGEDQYKWFKKTLESSNAKYKFVFAHHILGQGRGGIELAESFEWGGYDAGKYRFDSQRPGWGLPIHQLMKENNVDIFFQGHDHIYVKQELDGIIYQSVQMPSDSSYKIGITDNGDAYLSGKQLGGSGHLRVTVCSDSATVEYVSAVLPQHVSDSIKNGQILDSYSIVKKSPTSNINSVQQNPEWFIFPNPADNYISISCNQSVNSEITINIYSLEGRLIKQQRMFFDTTVQNIPIDYLLSGAYFVSVVIDKAEVSHKKLIVKH